MKGLIILAALIASLGARAGAAPVDPLTARVDDSVARRFADMWRATGGKPGAAQIQAEYLAQGGRAIEVFTPGRIGNADKLAAKIAANPAIYADAVERCLPWVEGTNAQLRSAYLGLRGLLPGRDLPVIAVVVGGNNSGGTAGEGIQVIGLEVICRLSPDRAAFEQRMRQFYAHETVHTLQTGDRSSSPDLLLQSALSEGVADYFTALVTGTAPDTRRDGWAKSREAMIWREFQADAAIVRADRDAKGEPGPRAEAAFRRWFGNAGDPPEGWPDELGYWVGMRIAEAYVAASRDPHRAIDELLAAKDPAAILRASNYSPKN